MDGQPYQMRPWDELLGQAIEVKKYDDHCLARIGKISVILPLGLATRLEEAICQQVGVLRTDNDYRFRLIREGMKGC